MEMLFETAKAGNVGELHRIICENPLILHYVALESRENPLHLACLCGHLDFAKEILILKPEFTKKLNPKGYSPLQMAAANGHAEIVKELIRFDRELCHQKGRDMITPLHSASVAGEIGVINEILSVCPNCIEDVTIQGETCLHLAGDARTSLLVIAVLVATATYQVGLSPPGGTWQDNNAMKTNNSSDSYQMRIAGTSILGTYDDVGFLLMIGLNSIGFSVSLSMIGMLTSRFPLRGELLICITALYTTYSIAVNSISPERVRVISIVFTSVLPTLVPVIIYLLRRYLGPMMRPMGQSLMKYKVVWALADFYG